jgi:nucleotide-binding universal stress UspA family protein
VQGDTKTELARFSEEEGMDLLVVGRRSDNKFKRVFNKKALTGGGLTSVSYGMVSSANCPTLVVQYSVTMRARPPPPKTGSSP